MNESELIIHSTNSSLFCCCYYRQTIICLASNQSLQLWDALIGTQLLSYSFQHELAPISLTLIKQSADSGTFLLQDKSGEIIILSYSESQKKINIENIYNIQIIGFAKLSIYQYQYDHIGCPKKSINNYFYTIRYNSIVQRKKLISGVTERAYTCPEDSFADATFMINIIIKGQQYFFIAEEGLSIKKIQFGTQSSAIDQINKFSILSNKEIKIILCIEPISQYRALVALREDKICIINLENMQMEKTVDFNFTRMIKTLTIQDNLFAVSGKERITVMKEEKLIKIQKIHTGFIMDIDVCEYAIYGVTQEGKIFFLPTNIC